MRRYEQLFGRLCRFSGEISYPIYITHFPLVYLQASWVGLHPNATTSQCIAVSAALFFLAIFNAYAALKLYDLPVRAWLSGRGMTNSLGTDPEISAPTTAAFSSSSPRTRGCSSTRCGAHVRPDAAICQVS